MPAPRNFSWRTAVDHQALRVAALCAGAVLLGVSLLAPGEAALRGLRVVPEATGVLGAAFPITLRNDSQTTVLSEPPSRMVSIAVTSDEILADLGAASRTVGVSRFVDDPRASSAIGRFPPSVARLYGDAESVLALEPDLAIVSGYTHAEHVALLEEAGIAVFRLGRPQTFAAIDETLRRLGTAVGLRGEADRLREAVHKRLTAAEEAVTGRPRPRVLFLSWAGYTSGTETLIDEIITRGGGTNAARDVGLRGTVPLSLEIALALRPDFVLTSSDVAGEDVAANALRTDPRWSQIDAVREGRILALPGALALSTSHHAAGAVTKVAAWLHGESAP